MYTHQDWETVVLKKKQPGGNGTSNEPKKTIPQSTLTASQVPAWKIEKQVDSEEGKPLNFVSKEDAQVIIKGRVAQKWTQKDLAVKLNLPLKTIQDIETCKAVQNKAQLAKIKKMLNI